MTAALKKEVQAIIDTYHFDSTPEELLSKTTLNWVAVSCHRPNLSPAFIKYFKDNLRMYWVSAQQQMPEKLILELANEVDWKMIYRCQYSITDAFREANRDRLKVGHLGYDAKMFHSWESWTEAWMLCDELYGESLYKECLKLSKKNIDLAANKFADHIKTYNYVNIRNKKHRKCTPEQIEEDVIKFIKIDFKWKLEKKLV